MRIIVGSLLVLSLAANAWLLVGRARVDVSRSAHASQPPASRRAEDPTGLLAGGGGGRDAARPRACRRALSRCRARGLRLMAAITAAGARRVATAGAGSGSGAAGSAGAAANKIDDAAKQQAALCDVARDHLRGHFAHHRDRIGKSLSRSLGDDAKQRKDRQHEVDRFAAALELSAAERSALDQRYEKLRAARVATARDALSRQPPDYAALLAAYQGLIGDQDRVVRELFGADAATKLRAAELRARAMVASVLAAFTKGAVPPW